MKKIIKNVVFTHKMNVFDLVFVRVFRERFLGRTAGGLGRVVCVFREDFRAAFELKSAHDFELRFCKTSKNRERDE